MKNKTKTKTKPGPSHTKTYKRLVFTYEATDRRNGWKNGKKQKEVDLTVPRQID